MRGVIFALLCVTSVVADGVIARTCYSDTTDELTLEIDALEINGTAKVTFPLVTIANLNTTTFGAVSISQSGSPLVAFGAVPADAFASGHSRVLVVDMTDANVPVLKANCAMPDQTSVHCVTFMGSTLYVIYDVEGGRGQVRKLNIPTCELIDLNITNIDQKVRTTQEQGPQCVSLPSTRSIYYLNEFSANADAAIASLNVDTGAQTYSNSSIFSFLDGNLFADDKATVPTLYHYQGLDSSIEGFFSVDATTLQTTRLFSLFGTHPEFLLFDAVNRTSTGAAVAIALDSFQGIYLAPVDSPNSLTNLIPAVDYDATTNFTCDGLNSLIWVPSSTFTPTSDAFSLSSSLAVVLGAFTLAFLM